MRRGEVVSLGIDYGQRLSIEMLFAAKQCAARGIERQVIRVDWKKPTRTIPEGRNIESIKTQASPAYLPGRNLVFLALGSAHASGIGADELHIGINNIDFSGYPDCTTDFFNAFGEMHQIVSPKIKIVAPLLHMSKPEIAMQAKELGIGPTDTWSCYRPQIRGGAVTPCRQCDACKLHDYAWEAILKAS